MDFTLTGTALGLCGWNVYLLWKKFYSRKKESKIKSFIEQQANLLIQEVAPYKKLKSNHCQEKKEQIEECFQTFISSASSNEPTPHRTVLEEVKQEKFLECKYIDGDTTFDIQPFFQKKESKKNKNNKDFSFSSQPQASKKEVKRCRKFSNINAIESNEDNEVPPDDIAVKKTPQKFGLSAIKEFNIDEKCATNEIQLIAKVKTPPQSPKIDDSQQIKPQELSSINNQAPVKALPAQPEGNMFASLLSNVKKADNVTNTMVLQTQPQGLFSNLLNTTNQEKQQEAPQQQGQASGLFSNIINKTNDEVNKLQPSGGLFGNLSNQTNHLQENQKQIQDVKPQGLFSNNINQINEQPQASIKQTESIVINNTGGLFGNPQPIQQSNQQQPLQSQGLFNSFNTVSQAQNTLIQQSKGLFGNLVQENNQQIMTQSTQNPGGLFTNIQTNPTQNQNSGLFTSILNSKPQEGGLFSNVQPPQQQQIQTNQQQSLFSQQQPIVQPQQQAQQIIQNFGSPQIFGSSFLQNNTLKDESKNDAGQLMQGGLFNLNSTVPGGNLFENIFKK